MQVLKRQKQAAKVEAGDREGKQPNFGDDLVEEDSLNALNGEDDIPSTRDCLAIVISDEVEGGGFKYLGDVRDLFLASNMGTESFKVQSKLGLTLQLAF